MQIESGDMIVKRKNYGGKYVSVVYDASTGKRIGWCKWSGSNSGAIELIEQRQQKKSSRYMKPEEEIKSRSDLIDHKFSHLVSFKVRKHGKTVTKYVTFVSNSKRLSKSKAYKAIAKWCLTYEDAIEVIDGDVDEESLDMRLLHTMTNSGR